MIRVFAFFISIFLLAACSGPKALGGSPNLQIVDGNVMPPPTRSDLFVQDRPYLIGPFDKLTIDVFGIEDLSAKKVQTDASGRIAFPLVGVVEAAGNTPAELAAKIEDGLRGRYIRNPQVIVNLEDTVSQVITVEGEVKEPGLYPVIGRMTLIRAVATAKGTGEFARLKDVVIFRTVNGQKMAALYNLEAIRRGAYDDPEVFASDVVVVGDSQARRIFRDILQASPLFLGPIIAVLQTR